MLFSLAVLGVIIHYSFTENTIRNQEEILQLKIDNLGHHTHDALLQHTDTIRQELLTGLDTGQRKAGRLDQAAAKLTSLIDGDKLFNSILIAETKSRKILLQTKSKSAVSFPPLPPETESAEPFSLTRVDDHFFLFWQPPLPDHSIMVALEVNRHEFEAALSGLFAIDQAILFLVDADKEPLLTIDHAQGTLCTDFESHHLESCQHGFNSLTNNNTYLYQHRDLFLGNHLYLLVADSYFPQENKALKNRITTGILVVGWLLIWAILIFAHKISSPITKLSQTTHDMIALNYDTEIKIPSATNEIEELYRNFEIMRKELKDLVTKDSLTKLHNRRYLMHVFEIAAQKAHRMEQRLSCIMLDIDWFKKINDNHGHVCGDAVLKEIGRIIIDTTRPYDTSGRYGGEEFIIILPETDADQALIIAERLRHKIADSRVKYGDTTIACTISLGVATFVPLKAESPNRIITNADFALYKAKRTGRNRTVLFEEGMATCHDCRIQAYPK